MTEVELRFWQQWYEANDNAVNGKVKSVELSVDVEHSGGYGDCDIDYGIDVSFRFEEGSTRAWDYVSLDDLQLDKLLSVALNFERDV